MFVDRVKLTHHSGILQKQRKAKSYALPFAGTPITPNRVVLTRVYNSLLVILKNKCFFHFNYFISEVFRKNLYY